MTTRQLSPQAPPSLAVALGASTPAGVYTGALLWSTTTGTLLAWNGTNWASLGAAVAATQVTLDFGALPVYEKGFSFADANVTTSSKILMTPAATSDEYEMDNFACAAYCAVNGTILAYIHAEPGPVTGTRKFNYILG